MAQTTQKRRREDPEVRRQQILDEAIRAIGFRGYRGFTVQALAQRCGLTNGGLLYYFGSKEQLLVAILEERDRREAEIIRTSAESALERPSSHSSVLQLFRAMIERNATQPELVRLYAVLQAEALDNAHPAHDYFLRREAMVLDVFARMVAPYTASPSATARQLLALMDGLGQQWLRAGPSIDLVGEWDAAAAMILPITPSEG